MSTVTKHWRFGFVLSFGMLSMALAGGCDSAMQREVVLRATMETLRDEIAQLKEATPAAMGTPATAVTIPSGQKTSIAVQPLEDSKEWWVANHRATTLWSSVSGGRVLALVPQWSYFLVVEPHVQGKLHVFLPGGQRASYAGDGWVEAVDLGPVGSPPPNVVDTSTLPKKLASPPKETVVTSTSAPRSTASSGQDSKLLNWRDVNTSASTNDLEMKVNSLLLGQDSYGGPYGSRISTARGTKILLADVNLNYTFRAGASAIEVHVDFFVVGDADGKEYRGLPVPIGNALPERFFLSSGQGFRGIIGFILPQQLKNGRLYFTNFLGPNNPPDRLTVYLNEIP